MADAPSSSKLVPGFDFLQSLAKSSGAALPGIGQWVAPILDPVELEKRIEELRTVQFWLEQNARMLGATIQALEVQRMTLSTLKTMNVQMESLRESLTIPAPQAATQPAQGTAKGQPEPAAAPAAQPSGAVVDPMQWWGALTRQFTELAAAATKDNALPGQAAAPAKPGAGAAVQPQRKAASASRKRGAPRG